MKLEFIGYMSEYKLKDLKFESMGTPPAVNEAKWMKFELRDTNLIYQIEDYLKKKKAIGKTCPWYKKVRIIIEVLE